MRSQLNVKPHSIMIGEKIIEIWYDKLFIGEVTAGEGPVVKIITKYPTTIKKIGIVVEVEIHSNISFQDPVA